MPQKGHNRTLAVTIDVIVLEDDGGYIHIMRNSICRSSVRFCATVRGVLGIAKPLVTQPPNAREHYITGPRVMAVRSAIMSNALMLNVGSPFISAIMGPSRKACAAVALSNR
jgi:hypothetical protein